MFGLYAFNKASQALCRERYIVTSIRFRWIGKTKGDNQVFNKLTMFKLGQDEKKSFSEARVSLDIAFTLYFHGNVYCFEKMFLEN